MQKHFLFGLVVLSFLASGCASRWLYQGRISAPDSTGSEQDHLAYWNVTQRKLWFDTAAGSVTLLSGCSTNTVQFDEQETGIVFRKRAGDRVVSGSGGDCGRILAARRIAELRGGALQLTVLCEPEGDEFTIAATDRYLKARAAPYEFRVSGRKVENPQAAAPKRPSCR